MGACVHHDGFVYDNISDGLTKYTQRIAVEQLLKEEALSINQLAQRERLERVKQRFKFICCNQTVATTSNMGGCKKGRHGFEQNGEVTIHQWEQMCDRNGEYLRKHKSLLDDRINSQNNASSRY
jgi:hypothetical protein